MTIHTLTEKAIAVTGLPEGAYNFHFYPEDDNTNDVSVLEWKEPIQKIGSFIKDSGHMIIPEGSWFILGRAAELTEEQWKRVVEVNESISYWEDIRDVFYINYDKKSDLDIGSFFCDPVASGHSLLKTKGLHVTNPFGSHPSTWEYIDIAMHKLPDDIKTWDKFQLLTNSLILIK